MRVPFGVCHPASTAWCLPPEGVRRAVFAPGVRPGNGLGIAPVLVLTARWPLDGLDTSRITRLAPAGYDGVTAGLACSGAVVPVHGQ